MDLPWKMWLQGLLKVEIDVNVFIFEGINDDCFKIDLYVTSLMDRVRAYLCLRRPILPAEMGKCITTDLLMLKNIQKCENTNYYHVVEHETKHCGVAWTL